MWPSWKENRLFFVLTAVFMVYAIAWLGLTASNKAVELRLGPKAERQPATIVVDGEGKVSAAPNIARIDLGFLTEKATVQDAQRENSEKMNRLLDELKKLGINPKDMQTTQYTIYPQYDYKEGVTKLRGYAVSQSVNVKIRDLEKIDEALAKAGAAEANQVGGLQFTLDDEDKLRADARKEAISKAQTKAVELARALGVRLTRIVAFNESTLAPPGQIFAFGKEVGGGGAAPEVEPGSLEVRVNVSLTYEIE